MTQLPLKILHLEQNPSDAEIICRQLKLISSEIVILHTKNKESFVKLLVENEFHLILSDYDPSGFDGNEAFIIAKELNPLTPFIYVSHPVGEDIVVEFWKDGVTDFVSKKNIGELIPSVEKVLTKIKKHREKKLAEIRITKSEARYRGLFEIMNEGLLLSTPKGIIKMVNPGFCRMVGYSADELIGTNAYDLLHDDKDRKHLKNKIKARRQGESGQYEVEFITKSGIKVWSQVSAAPYYDAKGLFHGVMSIITDITDRKLAEQEALELKAAFLRKLEIEVSDRTMELGKAKMELAASLKKERELGELKSRFVSTASHQFRTPLTVILSSIGILAMQMENMDDKFKPSFEKAYQRIREQIDRMTDVMNDVLIIGKINAGNINPVLKPVNLVRLCQSVASSYNEIQKDKRSLEVRVEGTPFKVNLDASLMEHSISNFVSNAFKYSAGKPSPILTILFAPESVRISIKDYGIGIPHSAIDHLFEPFYRASNVDDISGTGLGTAIAKEYIELNNGKIEVKSKLGEGSEFILFFELSRD